MRDHDEEAWSDAITFDRAIRTGIRGIRGEVYLHRSGVPLEDTGLSTLVDHGQLDLRPNECEWTAASEGRPSVTSARHLRSRRWPRTTEYLRQMSAHITRCQSRTAATAAQLSEECRIRTDAYSHLSGRSFGRPDRQMAGQYWGNSRSGTWAALNCAEIDLPFVRPLRTAVGMPAMSWPIPFSVVSHGARPTRSRFGMSDRQPASPRSACRNGGPELSSPAGCAAIPREAREPRPAVLHFISVPTSPPHCASATGAPGDARRSLPISSTAIETAIGAARNIEKE